MFPRVTGKLGRRRRCKQPSHEFSVCYSTVSSGGQAIHSCIYSRSLTKKKHMHACANEIFLLVSTHHDFPLPSPNMQIGGGRQKPGRVHLSSAAPATSKPLFQKWFALSILDLLLAPRVIIYLSYLLLKKMLYFQCFTHHKSVFLMRFALTAPPWWTGKPTSSWKKWSFVTSQKRLGWILLQPSSNLALTDWLTIFTQSVQGSLHWSVSQLSKKWNKIEGWAW